MKKYHIIGFLIIINALFVIAIIYNQNQITKTLYSIQRLNEHKQSLEAEKKSLQYQYQKAHDLSEVEHHASNTLEMKPIKLSEMKRISV